MTEIPSLPPAAKSPPLPRAAKPRPVAVTPVEDETLTWTQQLRRSIIGAIGAGFGASVIVHLAAILTLSIWVLDIEALLPEFDAEGAFRIGVKKELQDETEIALAEKRGGSTAPEPTLFNPSEFLPPKTITAKLPAEMLKRLNHVDTQGQGSGDSSEAGTGVGDGSLPSGGAKKGKNAVTKGSFTAWTIPEKPEIRKPYFIVIQVRIPKGRTRYQARDLRGVIVGTDEYRQRIPWEKHLASYPDPQYRRHTYRMFPGRKPPTWLSPKARRSILPIIEGENGERYCRLLIKVPGADAVKIQDTITVYSKMLKERQVLKIVF